MGKASSESWDNRGVTALQKSLVAIGGLHGDLREPQKWPVKQKSLISNSAISGKYKLKEEKIYLLGNVFLI